MSKHSGKDSIQEMEQIQKGLEEFLQRELYQAENGAASPKTEPQLFTIKEEEEKEKEIDIIGAGNRRRDTGDWEEVEEYLEDWDSPARRKKSAEPPSTGTARRVQSSKGQSSARQNRSRQSSKGQSSKGQSSPGQSSKGQSSQEGARSRRRQDRKVRDAYAQDESIEMGSKKKGKKQNRRSKEESREKAAANKKSGKRGSGLKKFLIVILVLIALLSVGLYSVVGMVYQKMHYHGIDSVASAPLREEGVVNVLLIGNDSRENGEDGRSDAMILLSISNKTGKIYMTSLLRDMYVEIPGHDGNRLNAAYSFGGAELLMETIEQNLDISVNRYVLVNFEAFAKLVDAVGGVELELTSEEIEYVNGYLVEYNMLTDRPQGTDNMDTSISGLVHLNGPQALAYSRNRYLGTDFGRTERQRKVLTAVIKKLPLALVTNPRELMDGLLPNLTTNLTQMECFRLSLMAGKLLTYDIEQISVPIEGSYNNASIRGMSVLEVDFAANRKYIKENIYGIVE